MSVRGCGALLILLPIACAVSGHALAGVSASLDSTQIAAGDSVQLTLEHDGRTSGQPDLTPLQQEFDILGTSSSTSVQIVNGSASEKSEVVLTLAPKTAGRLTIPSLSWGGERSQPLSLIVTGPGATSQERGAAASSAARVFIETSVSPEQPYVQAAVQLTVRLYAAETLYHADLELPDSSDVIAKQIGSDETSEVERNGRSYQVVTRHYLLFPLHNGKITLQGPVLDAEVAVNSPQSPFGSDPFGGGFFGGPSFGMLRTARPVRLHGSPITLSVRPRPAGAVGSYWLPARDIQLTATWNPSGLSAQTGDPVTLDLNLQATGLAAAQLPDLSTMLRLPSGLKAYPDQPKLDDTMHDGALVGSRDQTIALMADSAGHYTIPALTVSWWDTQTNQARVATLPARTLTILAAPGATSATASAPPAIPSAPRTSTRQPGAAATPLGHRHPVAVAQKPAREHSPSGWEWISIGLAVVWLSTLAGWLWSRRSPSGQPRSRRGRSPSAAGSGPAPSRPDASKERAAFRTACQTNDAHSARAHLMAWATAQWGTVPAGVNAIAARMGDPNITELLRDLDRACYADGDWQGASLAGALTELPMPPAKSTRGRDGLAPLYP